MKVDDRVFADAILGVVSALAKAAADLRRDEKGDVARLIKILRSDLPLESHHREAIAEMLSGGMNRRNGQRGPVHSPQRLRRALLAVNEWCKTRTVTPRNGHERPMTREEAAEIIAPVEGLEAEYLIREMRRKKKSQPTKPLQPPSLGQSAAKAK